MTRATPRAPARAHVHSGYELGPEPFPRKHALLTLCLGSPRTRAGGVRRPHSCPSRAPLSTGSELPHLQGQLARPPAQGPVTHPGGSRPKQLLPAPEGPAARVAPAARSPRSPQFPRSTHRWPHPADGQQPHIATTSRGAAWGRAGAPGDMQLAGTAVRATWAFPTDARLARPAPRDSSAELGWS